MKLKTVFTFTVAALLLSACGMGAAPAVEAAAIPTVLADTAIVSEGRLEPIRYAELALNANGVVSEVLVTEGQQVEAGQVIARLESNEAKTLETAQADVSQELTVAYQGVRDAQFKLDNFDVPSDFADLTPPQAVSQTLEKLNTARAEYDPYKNLGANNDTRRESKKRLDNAWAKYRKAIQWMELQSHLDTAESRLVQAQKEYDALHDSSFAEITAGARASLANSEVRAPFAGIITTLDLKVGEFASAGQPVVTIADASSWAVKTTDVTEIDVVELAEGDPATVRLDAIPDVELKGNILSIGQSYSQTQGDIVYEVTILLTDKGPAMRWGMTAEVRFE